MDEMVNTGSVDSSPNAITQPAPQVENHQPVERTFKQSEVDNIVKRVKQDAIDTYRRMQTEQPQYLQQKYGDNPTQHPNALTQDDIRRLAAEEAQRLRDDWVNETNQKQYEANAQRTVQEFYSKVNPGRDKYSDFDKVTGDIELAKFPNVVQLLAQYVDNSDAVLYELGKDRIKLVNLEMLANMSPNDAIVQARRLANSLKENEDAQKVKLPNEPLSQLRPSNTGTDNGVMSVSDYRKKYRV